MGKSQGRRQRKSPWIWELRSRGDREVEKRSRGGVTGGTEPQPRRTSHVTVFGNMVSEGANEVKMEAGRAGLAWALSPMTASL